MNSQSHYAVNKQTQHILALKQHFTHKLLGLLEDEKLVGFEQRQTLYGAARQLSHYDCTMYSEAFDHDLLCFFYTTYIPWHARLKIVIKVNKVRTKILS